ncbi:unnamed protein product [Ceratitis capitata]|uniref:(Mediterranean fruit fly) hypothetical protein n=1 Tax=Ceratitis capitata TaxID=7213 RepID=A0A811UXZ9_CERCA|nr:unnamed protein product [Ceratitis capitata]
MEGINSLTLLNIRSSAIKNNPQHQPISTTLYAVCGCEGRYMNWSNELIADRVTYTAAIPLIKQSKEIKLKMQIKHRNNIIPTNPKHQTPKRRAFRTHSTPNRQDKRRTPAPTPTPTATATRATCCGHNNTQQQQEVKGGKQEKSRGNNASVGPDEVEPPQVQKNTLNFAQLELRGVAKVCWVNGIKGSAPGCAYLHAYLLIVSICI